MNKKQLLFGDNADSELVDLLKNKYKYYTVVLVVSSNLKKKNLSFINKINSVVQKLKIVEFPDGVKFNNLCISLVKKELTDAVGLVLVLGSFEWVNPICELYNNVIYLPTMPSLNSLKTMANVTVCDFNRVINCSLHNWVNCVGEVAIIFSYIMEQVFLKSVYNVEVDNNNLIKLENYLFSLCNMPQKILNSRFGKLIFIKHIIEISKCVEESFYNSIVINLSNNIINLNRSKTLPCGVAQIYSTKIMFNAFMFLYNVNALNELVGFNYFNRLTEAKKYNKFLNSTFISNNLLNFNSEIKNIKNNFFVVQDNFKNVLNNYYNNFLKLFNKYINMQYDKGISYLKFFSPEVITKAFNLLPEQSEEANFVTFLREFGFYNKF